MFRATLLISLLAIRRNILRSALTVLGIVIGVASVAALVTIGQGAKAQVANEIGAMGENLLMIRPGADHMRGRPHTSAPSFELEDVVAIEREVRGIAAVAPSSSTMKVVIFGNTNRSTSVTGTTSAYLTCRRYEIGNGRDFSPLEERSMRPVCILGATVEDGLFGGADPVGQIVRVGKMPCTVIGTLKEKGENVMGMDQDDLVLMPIRVFQRRVAGKDGVANISVSVAENRTTKAVKGDVEALLRERRRAATGAEDDFVVRDLTEIATAVQQTTAVMTTLLAAIAAVSLLVGGIGIMNIMLVSVTERTREIGIRMAVGATAYEVRLQFLVEAALISGLGGVIGLLVGNGGAYVATHALGMPFIPSPTMAAVALIFSVGVGVLFGFLPAHRASKLNPVEALRYE